MMRFAPYVHPDGCVVRCVVLRMRFMLCGSNNISRAVYTDLPTGIDNIIVFLQNRIGVKSLIQKWLGTLSTLTAKISRPRGGPSNKLS